MQLELFATFTIPTPHLGGAGGKGGLPVFGVDVDTRYSPQTNDFEVIQHHCAWSGHGTRIQ